MLSLKSIILKSIISNLILTTPLLVTHTLADEKFKIDGAAENYRVVEQEFGKSRFVGIYKPSPKAEGKGEEYHLTHVIQLFPHDGRSLETVKIFMHLPSKTNPGYPIYDEIEFALMRENQQIRRTLPQSNGKFNPYQATPLAHSDDARALRVLEIYSDHTLYMELAPTMSQFVEKTFSDPNRLQRKTDEHLEHALSYLNFAERVEIQKPAENEQASAIELASLLKRIEELQAEIARLKEAVNSKGSENANAPQPDSIQSGPKEVKDILNDADE